MIDEDRLSQLVAAYTFFRRSDGRAVRVAARPGAWRRDPEHQALFAKVREGTATDDERARFRERLAGRDLCPPCFEAALARP